MASKAFQVIPRNWRGIRDSESELLLETNEWSTSRNFDSRYGWSGAGSTLLQTLPNAGLTPIGMRHFFDKSGVVHRVVITNDGGVYEDNVLVAAVRFTAAGVTIDPTTITGQIPQFAMGAGGVIVARGTALAPIRKDPADNTWKELSGSPKFDGVSFERGGPRLFGFPNSITETDTVAWSAVGDFTQWTAANGGGSEPIGNDRQPIQAIEGGLEDAMAYYKRDHIYVRTGTDPDSWKITLVSSDVGLTAPLSLIRIGKAHFFIHESGMYFLNSVGAILFPPRSERIQESWDKMVKTFGDYLRFAHAAYHPRERTIYAWVPGQLSRVMNTLYKVYVPDGSVTIHDNKPAASSDYHRQTRAVMTRAHNSQVLEVVGATDNGTAITSTLTTGIFAGTPPRADLEKRWGFKGVIYLYFDADAGVTVTVTPRLYRGDALLVGIPQTKALVANRVTKMKLKMSDAQGWGFDLTVEATTSAGRWRLLGYSGEYTEVTDA